MYKLQYLCVILTGFKPLILWLLVRYSENRVTRIQRVRKSLKKGEIYSFSVLQLQKCIYCFSLNVRANESITIDNHNYKQCMITSSSWANVILIIKLIILTNNRIKIYHNLWYHTSRTDANIHQLILSNCFLKSVVVTVCGIHINIPSQWVPFPV